ncbi:MAG TPA: SDR family NAD(P)-dependent oxidoreductase, partial [Terrimicrobiaceae bacterium]|nr:SDR family NAD(P)-dependent oxidoreductase [Terrimicrobiaceae bacterium]
PEAEKPTLYAGINSFGYGGTNAHVLLESAPSVPVRSAADAKAGPQLIPFSATNERALRDLAGKMAFQLGQPLPGTLSDLAYSAAFRRSHLAHRGAALAENLGQLREQLIAVSTGQPHDAVVTGAPAHDAASGLVFVYTGMGPQWWAMGQELIRGEPVVAAAIDEIDAVFQPLAGWSLREAMLADEATSRMEHTDLAQPANFALQAALTRLWESHGIRPAAVVGHSVGEVAAAYAAGVYTLEEAVRVSYHRSRLQQTMAGRGAMLAAGLAEPEAEKLLAAFPGVSLAAVNSFSAVTLSGDAEELRAIAADLEQRGIFHKFLRVEVAYHSPQMDPLREELLSVLADLAPRPARLPLYSTAFGAIVPHHEWTAEYWWRNVRQPVRFAAAMQAAMAEGFAMFLEVGPHPVLGNSIKECAAHLERRVVCFTSLRRKEPEKARMLLTLGELYCAGCDPDWTALAPTSGRLLPAPQYPWQRETHWVESERSKMERLGLPGPVYLNRTVSGPNPCWEVEINRNYFPFLFDHGVQDQTVFAGMGYIEAALALSRKIHGTEAVVLENVSFERVLIVDPAKLQYLLTEHDADGGRFVVSSRTEGDDDGAQRHCRGRMFPQSAPQPGTLDLAALRERLTEEVRGDAFYERLRRRQLHYGPAFRTAKQLLRDGDSFLLTIDTSAVAGEDLHPLHPSIFDAALQAVIYCASGEQLFVPFGFERFQYFARPVSDACHAFGRIISQTATRIVSDVWLADANGAVIARACGLALQIVELAGAPEQEELFYAWRWEPVPHGGEGAVDGKDFLVLADAEDSDLALARALAGRLPGSALEIREIAAPRGLGRPEMERLLRAHGRRRIVVLWGSGPAASGVDAALGLSEKAVGLLQAVGAADAAGGVDVTFVTRGAVPAAAGEGVPNLRASALGAIGLTALNEFEGLVCRTVDLDSAGSADLVLAELGAGGSGDIAWRGGERMERVLRVRKEEKSPPVLIRVPVDDALELQPVAKGGLDALQLVRGERTVPGPGEIEIRIHRAALGTRDLLKIRGEIHPVALENALGGPEPGLECTGIVSRCGPGSRFSPGDRVAALVPRALRTYATVSETLAVPLPEQWGMDAAAIPAAGLAAWVGLLDLARLQPGDRVFLPDAADGPGLAAVDVALRAGAEVFATAASEEHRQALRARGVAHVFSSEGLDCRERIRDATDGEGVDVIFGAESGLARLASLGLLRSGGRCIATGKNDIAEDRDLPLRVFNRNAMFAALDVARLAFESPARVRDHLGKMFAQFAEGDLPPPATRTFPADQIREAFAALAAGPAPETVLIDFATGDAGVPETPEDGPLIKKDGSYIVTGGTSGFGLATARWLATQGAGKVFLVSRSGRRAPGLQDTTRFLTAQGAEAEVLSVDVTDAAAVRSLVEQAGRAPFALRGIVHGAMVLGDAMMQDLDEEKFRRVFLPKVSGAWHLADAVADRGGLDFLVFYSSVSALVGNRGQANYVAANSLLDGLAHELRHRGVPALSVNWGALGESGVVSRDEHLSGVLAALGITGLQNQQALGALETSLRAQEPQRGIFLVDWEKWHAAHPKLREDPRFRALRSRTAKDGNDAASQIRQSLADATREQRISALENSLQEVLANTLKMPKDAVPVNRRINEMGVDSLMVLELGLGIRERIGISFSAMEFLKGPNLRQLAVLAEGRLWKN